MHINLATQRVLSVLVQSMQDAELHTSIAPVDGHIICCTSYFREESRHNHDLGPSSSPVKGFTAEAYHYRIDSMSLVVSRCKGVVFVMDPSLVMTATRRFVRMFAMRLSLVHASK